MCKVPGKCVGSVLEVGGECVGSVWEVPAECVESAREVSGEVVLEVVGSVELSPNTCKTLP